MILQHLTRVRGEIVDLGTRFGRDAKGTVAVALGVSAIVLTAIVGGSVDFAQAYIARTKLQNAVDAAALAATSQYLQDPSHNATAALTTADVYFANTMQGWSGASASAVLDQASFTVRMEGQVSVRTPFLSMLGISTLAINVRSEASGTDALGSGRNDNEVEMSLMLDVTGSMNQPSGSGSSKLAAMQHSAKRMIDILIPDTGAPHAKVALAPFARSVNVGDYIGAVTGLPLTIESGGTKHLRRCVTERTGAQRLTDVSPASGTWVPVHRESGSRYVGSLTAAESCSQSHRIIPLTSNKSALKGHIDSLDGNGYTAGALGTAWAWYLLSPEWSHIFTGVSAPRPYGTNKLRKIAVLLTDGTYNTLGGNPYSDGSSEAEAISQQAVDLCSGMKARSIEVFTIGFRLDNDLARNTMRNCATSEDMAFLAENAEQLEAAFNDIAYRVVPLHLKK